MLVIHYTGMKSCTAALNWMCDPNSEVSAHFLIDEDGTTYRLVAEQERAWHVGAAYWRGVTDINSASIGIELVNQGHLHGYRPFPEAQVDALISLGRQLMVDHNIPKWGVIGHSDIAPGRKVDPGELFPWKSLAMAGLGIWPDSQHVAGSRDLWADMGRIGYAVPGDPNRGGQILSPEAGQTDVICAFQRHFRPKNISGELDIETQQLIAQVARKSS